MTNLFLELLQKTVLTKKVLYHFLILRALEVSELVGKFEKKHKPFELSQIFFNCPPASLVEGQH